MKGFKAFGKGMICRGKQYAENTVFEEKEAEIGRSGMHFCENPLDVLDYYPLVDENGDIVEVAKVEALDECRTNDNKKYCTKKLKIGVKLSLASFVKAAINFAFENTNGNASSGNGAQLASSGDYAKLASSGYGSSLASSGDGSSLASSGDDAKLASSGDYAQLASSGNGSSLASSGDGSSLASSGYGSSLASSGDGAVIAGIGIGNEAKGKKGSWLVLAEWGYNDIERKYIPICVKAAQIDGVEIKEDTFYKLENGEFKEA